MLDLKKIQENKEKITELLARKKTYKNFHQFGFLLYLEGFAQFPLFAPFILVIIF